MMFVCILNVPYTFKFKSAFGNQKCALKDIKSALGNQKCALKDIKNALLLFSAPCPFLRLGESLL